MILLYLQGSWGQSDTIYSFRALKLSTLENCWALKLFNLDNSRTLKASDLADGSIVIDIRYKIYNTNSKKLSFVSYKPSGRDYDNKRNYISLSCLPRRTGS